MKPSIFCSTYCPDCAILLTGWPHHHPFERTYTAEHSTRMFDPAFQEESLDQLLEIPRDLPIHLMLRIEEIYPGRMKSYYPWNELCYKMEHPKKCLDIYSQEIYTSNIVALLTSSLAPKGYLAQLDRTFSYGNGVRIPKLSYLFYLLAQRSDCPDPVYLWTKVPELRPVLEKNETIALLLKEGLLPTFDDDQDEPSQVEQRP